MIYCYACECGEKFSRVLTVAQAGRQLRCPSCRKKCERDYVTEHSKTAHHPGNWPMKSEALGVMPGQQKEAYEDSVKRGVPTQFDASGKAIFESQKHRKEYAEALPGNWFDKDGGYGDPQRR